MINIAMNFVALPKIFKRRLREAAQKKVLISKNDPNLESDLKSILGDYVPRRFAYLNIICLINQFFIAAVFNLFYSYI